MQPRDVGGGGMSWSEKLAAAAEDIGNRLPPLFDTEKVAVQYPTVFEESMNTVLVQELGRFNHMMGPSRFCAQNTVCVG